MRTTTLTHDTPGCRAKLILREAAILDGLRRDQMIADAFREEHTGEPPVLQTARVVLYPSCMACLDAQESALEVDGSNLPLPLTFEAFLALPETLVKRWLDAALELNPHWAPDFNEPPEETEKKA